MNVEQTGFREIFNFEHHLTSEGTFSIGPYEITVRKEHIGGDFARPTQLIFTSIFGYSEDKQSVRKEPSSSGTWRVTAVVAEHEKLDQPSVLSPENPSLNGAYDLSVILSLLSGRHTQVGKDAKPYLPVSPGRAITSNNFFRTQQKVDWGRLPDLQKVCPGGAMEAVLLAMTNSHGFVKILMGASALDGLVTRWYNDSNRSPYTKEIKNKLANAGKLYIEYLVKNDVDDSIIQDIEPRLPNLANVSALTKLTAFLTAGSMYPENPDENSKMRLKWLNTFRNSVSHTGFINLNIIGSPEVTLRVGTGVALLLQNICRIYIAKFLFKIEDQGVDEGQQAVMDFFLYGTFNGQNIFTEDSETYMQRLIDHFEKFGNIDL